MCHNVEDKIFPLYYHQLSRQKQKGCKGFNGLLNKTLFANNSMKYSTQLLPHEPQSNYYCVIYAAAAVQNDSNLIVLFRLLFRYSIDLQQFCRNLPTLCDTYPPSSDVYIKRNNTFRCPLWVFYKNPN